MVWSIDSDPEFTRVDSSLISCPHTQLSLRLLPDGAVCRAGSWCEPASSPASAGDQTGWPRAVSHTDQRSLRAPKEPWCVCSLHTQGIHVPGRGPGSHPAQHAPSGDPKPFQKISGIFPILQYEVGSPAWNYPVKRISLHISKAWNTEWKHVTHLPISFSPTCLL